MPEPDTLIRDAIPEDAVEAARVAAASICALCGPDHGGQSDLIAHWTANKTPGQMRRWIAGSQMQILVAEREGRIVGIGAVRAGEEIALLYVDPAARFTGVSTALLAVMERRLPGPVARLTSTATARAFYRSRGWRDSGPPQADWGLAGFPMEKRLA